MTTWTTIVDGIPVETSSDPQDPITWETISGESSAAVQTNLDAHINDTSGAHADSAITFTPAGTGAVATTVQAKLRESVSVKDFGAVGDGSTDDTDAFKAAILAADKIYVPPGTYLINETLNIKDHPVHLFGPAGTQDTSTAGWPAVLQFADDIVGIFVHRFNTNADASGVPSVVASGMCGDGTVIEKLHIRRGTGAQPTGDDSSHGIWSKTRIRIQDCMVSGFQGNNIHIVASAGTEVAATEGNANLWNIDSVRSITSGGNGLYVDGADANAGIATLLDCSTHAKWGIYDSSFLGNTYIACHTDACTLGAYKTDDNNARNVFDGCYSESGQDPSSLVYPTLVVGGLHGAGFTSDSTAAIISNRFGKVQVNALNAYKELSSESYEVIVNGDASNGDIFSFQRSDVSSNNLYRLKWANTTTGDIVFDYNNLGAARAFLITGANTAFAGGRSAAVPYAFVPYRLFVGDGGADSRQITCASAAPSTGEWGQGDIVFNIGAAAGGTVGWVCVTAGTPGTWKTFGAIEA